MSSACHYLCVLSTNKTFPVAFSYCPSESNESISSARQSLKEECSILGIVPPREVLGGSATVTFSLKANFQLDRAASS